MNYFFGLLSSISYLFVMGLIFRKIFLHSDFWPIFLSIEYFYILGLGIFPLFLFLGFVQIPPLFELYNYVDSINPLTFFHIGFYAFGSLIGFFYSKKLSTAGVAYLLKKTARIKFNPLSFFYLLAIFSIISSVIYFWIVGFDRAILGASASRGGDFSDFEGFEEFVFLKRFAIVGLYGVAAFPFIFAGKKNIALSFFTFFSVGILGYVMTVSRFALFEGFVTPLLMYLAYTKSTSMLKKFSIYFLIGVFCFAVFRFGKEFIGAIGSFLFSGTLIELSNVDHDVDFLSSFSHLFFSVDAGINNFFSNGPFIAKDIILSVLGVVPSGVFSSLGLENLSYQLVNNESRFSCINSEKLIGNNADCIIPPYYIGASAYFFPLGGAFLFGFFRFYLYSVMHRTWIFLRGKETLLVLPYIIFLVLNQVMLFIPATISLAVFFSILFFLYLIIINFLVKVKL